jgi:HK97 family phage portal protein
VASLVQRALGAVSRVWRPPVAKQLIGGNYWLPITGGFLPGDAPWNFWQLGYNPAGIGQSAVVSACVAAYAQTTAMCPGTHWRSTDDGGRERVSNSALSRVLKRPNSYQSISDFLLNLTHNLYAEGNAYALALRNNRYEISELHLMNPRMSMPMIAVNGDIYYSLGGNFVADKLVPSELLSRSPARDVLHIKLDSRPENPLIGEPPLTAAMLDVAASNAMVQQQLSVTSNSARPSGVIQTDMQLDEQQTKELRAAWDEQTKGAGAGGTPILSWGLKWQQVSPSSRDAQLAEMLQLTDTRIATAYRVPPELLGIAGQNGLQSSTEALMRYWIAEGLGFCLNHIEEAIGRFFGLAGQPDEYLEFDTRILVRSADKDRIDALARGVQGGIYSPNEARALEDLPAAEDGDEPRVQQQVVPLSFGAQPPPAPTPAVTPPPPAAEEGDNPDGDAKRAISAYRRRRLAA